MTERAFHRVALCLIATWGGLLYAHTLPFPFVFDDIVYLVNNPLFKDFGSFFYWRDWSAFATLSQRMGLDPDLSTNLILRPVTYLTFHLNYLLGGLQPAGYRAANIAIHCANGILIYGLLRVLLGTSPKRASLPAGSARFIALTTALVFVVHPLQTESVTYIVQRFTSLGACLYLLTVLTYFAAPVIRSGAWAPYVRGSSVAVMVLGLLTKESVFTAPFMIMAIDTLVMGTPLRRACRNALPHLLCLPLLPIMIAITATAQHGGRLSLTTSLNIANSVDMGYSLHDYALNQLHVVVSYLRLIAMPTGLTLDRDVPMVRSLANVPVIRALVVIVLLNGAAWYWFLKRPGELRPSLVLCGVSWFFVVVAPSSSIVPLPDLMAEHRAYLPSFGAIMALVCGLDAGRVRAVHARVPSYYVMAGVGIWVLVLTAATTARNHVWRSEITLWRDTALKSFHKFRPWSNLGVAYFEHHQTQAGLACMQRAVQLEPRFVNGYANLSTMHNALGEYRQAIAACERGLAYAPDSALMRYNMGLAYLQLGQTNDSIRCLADAARLWTTDARPYAVLAVLYAALARHDDARTAYQHAVALNPKEAYVRQAIREAGQLLEKRTESTPPVALPAASSNVTHEATLHTAPRRHKPRT